MTHLRYLETQTGQVVTYFIAGEREEIQAKMERILNEFPPGGYQTSFSPIAVLSTEPHLFFTSGWRARSAD